MAIITWDQENLILALYIQPNAKQDKVVGVFNDRIKIQISAPAVDQKANDHLLKWLAKEFKVSKSTVVLLKGEQSRQKTLTIKSPKHIPDWLKELME